MNARQDEKIPDGGNCRKTTQQVFIREVTARYSGSCRKSLRIREAADATRFLETVLKDNAREHFIALFLDGAHQVVSYAIVSIGTASNAIVHAREVFQPAILAGACAIIVAHNHPSGDLQPSCEDHAVTRRLVDAGKLLGIPVLDHIILSDSGLFSFAASGLIPA